MALKNMIKVGDKVTFGRAGEKKVSGTVVKCNPKTAHIKTRQGTFSVTYGLIQKPSKKTATKKPTKVITSPDRVKIAKMRAATKAMTDAQLLRKEKELTKRGGDPDHLRILRKEIRRRGKTPTPVTNPRRKKPAAKKKPTTRDAVNKHNPANFTKKGERMYQHIKAGYRAAGKSEKDAKQIAASTVYMKARTIPGLVKKKRATTAKKNPPKCSTTGRYAVIVRSGSKDHCTFATNNRAMANRAAKAMAAKGKNAFVWDKEKRK